MNKKKSETHILAVNIFRLNETNKKKYAQENKRINIVVYTCIIVK